MRFALVAVLLFAAVACESESKTETPSAVPAAVEPAKDKPASAVPVKKPAAKPAAPSIQFDGTPHDEEFATIALSWKSKGGEVALHELPSTNSKEVGKLTVKTGASIKLEDSVVVVITPNVLVAKKGAKIFGASAYDPMTKTTEEQTQQIEIPAGEELSVLKYVGEGTCYVLYSDITYNSGCPSEEFFEGDHKIQGPVASDWWIRPVGSDGWLKVDARFDVKVGSSID